MDRETRLGLIAASILEGQPVNWSAVESTSDPEDKAVLGQLRVLEEVTALHRRLAQEPDGQASGASPHRGHAMQWGHLRVLEPIGKGSFGEVYRAWDTHLDREVALKLLRADPAPHDPTATLSDPSRVVHEGRLLARVRHPNVITVYGAEPRDGSVGIWMEFIRGTTLHRLVEQQGRLGAREAGAIGADLCRALAAVHRAGLLHRDISARNVMREEGGRVVLMDFGAGHDDRAARERSRGVTGTPLYMAPELFAGRPADQRSDIYALGTLLFFLVTGRYPVTGGSLEEVREAHARGERTRLRDLRADLPAAFVQAIERSLHADPAERHQTAGELESALEAREHTGGKARDDARAGSRARSVLWLVAGLAAAAAAGFLGGGLYSSRSATPQTAPVRRVTVQLPVVLPASTSGGGPTLAIAPDGSAVAFTARSVGQNQLFVHRLVDATTVTVRGPANPNSPSFSPDGSWLAFGAIGDGFWRASAEGGEAEPFCAPPIGDGVRGTAWDAAGRAFFGSSVGLFEAPSVGGPCQLVLKADGQREARFLWPQILPSGRGMLLTVSSASDDADSASIVVIPAGTTERRVVVRDARAGRLTKSGHLLFARGHQIFAAPFDLDRLTTSAEPVLVLDGVAWGQFGGPLMDVSDSGDLVYVPGQGGGNRLVWVTRDGIRSDAGAPRRHYVSPPRLSPDGRWVAVSIGTADHFLWVYSLDAGALSPLTSHDSHVAVWSPDSRSVAFPQGDRIAIKDRDTTSEAEAVREERRGTPATWSPDRTTIVGSRDAPAGGYELFALRLAGGTTQTLLRGRRPFLGAEFSPDGRWLAYASSDSGQLEVYVTDFPAAKIKTQASTDGGFAPVWARNGRELFYVNGTSMMTAAVRPGASIAFERAVRLFEDIDLAVGNVTTYSVAPDGRFLVVEEGQPGITQRRQLTLVLNWFEELRRLVPVSSDETSR